MIDVQVLEVTGEVRDRLAAEGQAGADERRFNSALEVVARPLPGILVQEFSPYLLAFGGFPAGGGSFAVALPQASWGTQWTATATPRGTERVTLPAGSFDALRVDVFGSRNFIRGQMDDAIDPTRLYSTAWYAPAVKRVVQLSRYTQAAGLNILERDQYQLISVRVA
jgi:hypothetical protein